MTRHISLVSLKPSLHAMRCLALSAAILLPILPVGSVALAAPPTTLTFGADTPGMHGSKLGFLVFSEAFKRMGISLQLSYLPIARRTAMEDSGEVDGDMGRVYKFGDEHPNLVRVQEPWTEMRFALYASKPALKMTSLDELKSKDLAVEYRRGVLYCENKLKSLGLKHLSDITNEIQALKKLSANRIDLYCDLENQVRSTLSQQEFENEKDIFMALDLGGLPIHAYVHKKHAALAPELSEILKKMKAEGLIEVYRKQIDRELKITR